MMGDDRRLGGCQGSGLGNNDVAVMRTPQQRYKQA
jgi:hypothetical protein